MVIRTNREALILTVELNYEEPNCFEKGEASLVPFVLGGVLSISK